MASKIMMRRRAKKRLKKKLSRLRQLRLLSLEKQRSK
jgi:hypothetical protein